ncbi:glycosyltransferase involved in cell wall biosynthesis [Erythromicrobium ramosum]|uniref:Glycosyltransferase n=1 Tax=Erythrobacter ramosus TaxID=35811 RepID=A0A6I4UQY6_9SPHN|nr:glycosyltransferase family 2 protein [Erythrobacter ramosus]MBB3777203.1 glycosyltransferase involved in cell wall biosynthesis [Erythrobacter ramosus]MXP39963.1 glycosyltransferase [Erythrobacter ramosus]
MTINCPVRASVIIGTRNRPAELKACLASVVSCLGPADELIVVDSASDNAEAIKEIAEEAGALYLRENIAGAARARNVGIRKASGEVMAFTDDDALVAPDWIERLIFALDNNSVDVVVGPVFELGSNPKRLLITFRSFIADEQKVLFNKRSGDWFDRLAFGAIGVGANMAVTRHAFKRVGLFDERLGQGRPVCGDDSLFLFSALNYGLTVVNEPLAEVYHPRNETHHTEVEESRVAYLILLLLRWPSAIVKTLQLVAKRSHRQAAANTEGNNARGSVLRRAIWKAPGLVFKSLFTGFACR